MAVASILGSFEIYTSRALFNGKQKETIDTC
jgi:hypothetical protein